jgi:hypothetical protein
MHIRQEEYMFDYVKEKILSYLLIEEFYTQLPILSFREFDFLFELLFS